MSDERLPVAIIGAGALGGCLAARLASCGYVVTAVVSRSRASAERVAAAVGAPVASSDPADLPEAPGRLFCCVPDDAVAPLAARLAELPRSWSGSLVAHTSGVLASDVLEPLARRGAATLSFHPFQAFPPGASPDRFDGIGIGIEGEPGAVGEGCRLAEALGAVPVPLDREAKILYHAAAVVASNFLVTLAAAGAELLTASGVDAAAADGLLRPLLAGTLGNLAERSPETALTGPIVRGDAGTVGRHLEALRVHAPHLLPVYAALGEETLRLAHRSGRLGAEPAGALQRMLRGGGAGSEAQA